MQHIVFLNTFVSKQREHNRFRASACKRIHRTNPANSRKRTFCLSVSRPHASSDQEYFQNYEVNAHLSERASEWAPLVHLQFEYHFSEYLFPINFLFLIKKETNKNGDIRCCIEPHSSFQSLVSKPSSIFYQHTHSFTHSLTRAPEFNSLCELFQRLWFNV